MIKAGTKFDVYIYTDDNAYVLDDIDTYNCSCVLHILNDFNIKHSIVIRYTRNGNIISTKDYEILYNFDVR